MKRKDFLFTIGYRDDVALVDSTASKKYGGLFTEKLLEKGLFKAAFCSALYAGGEEEALTVLAEYNRQSGSRYQSVTDLKRLFGVFEVPAESQKVSYI